MKLGREREGMGLTVPSTLYLVSFSLASLR